jgi:hypothetical protein
MTTDLPEARPATVLPVTRSAEAAPGLAAQLGPKQAPVQSLRA